MIRFAGYYLVSAMFTVLLLSSCGGQQSIAPVSSRGEASRSAVTQEKAARTGKATYYQVRAGDTLYSISWRSGYDYREVAAWNNIGPPYQIHAGQRLLLTPPTTTEVSKTSPLPNLKGQAESAPSIITLPPSAKAEPPLTAPPVEQDNQDTANIPAVWTWPTQGKVIGSFASGEKGLRIAGKENQPIQAAAPGRVVYSGSGLVGLGELVIIKHDKSFLSAYAHNKKLLVKEGDQVTLGQSIAEMGNSGADRVMLYFEIRKDGKPVDPLSYLPQRK